MRKQAESDIRQLLQEAGVTPSGSITEADLTDLPGPVRTYLVRSGIIGKDLYNIIRLEQSGRIRMAPDKPWMDFTAEQHYSVNPPGFVWHTKVKSGPFRLRGRDLLHRGSGHMMIRLGFINLVNARGMEMDQGSMTRYLSEVIWFPQAFLSEYISWEAVDSLSAKATLAYRDQSVSGIFIFNESGDFVDFKTERYADTGKGFIMRDWNTPATEYREFSGYLIPAKAAAEWLVDGEKFRYIDLEITALEYR